MSLMKKLTSGMVAASLVFGLVGTAMAEVKASDLNAAADRMQKLGIVAGIPQADGTVDLALSSNITRAQLVKIIVWAFGQKDNAALLKGAATFTDVSNHWASGEIAIAKAMAAKNGLTLGMPDGSFKPDQNVSAAEAIAFVMKFLGAKPATGLQWPMDYIQGALDAGIISADDKAMLAAFPNSPANRGLSFYLADKAFSTYKMADGKTAYTAYVDTTAPTLSVDAVAATTEDASVTVSGSASGQNAITVNGSAVTADASGKFSATVDLKLGANDIVVAATDLAGNASTKTVSVTRNPGAAASIEAADITVAAGATVDVAATVKDKAGNAVNTAVTGDATAGTFADGKYTAGKVAGNATLTLKAGDATLAVKVTVTAGPLAKVSADKSSADVGEKVTLSATDEFGNAISGATFSVDSADALIGSNGVFIGSKVGSYTVTAKAGDATATAKVGVYSATVDKYTVTMPTSVVANNDSTFDVTIAAVDANGNVIASNDDAMVFGDDATFEKVSSDGSTGVLAATLKDGVATIKVRTKAGAAGGQIVKFDVTGPGGKTGSANIELVDQVATGLKVTANSKFIGNNTGDETSTFAVEVVDQTGAAMEAGTWPVHVALSGDVALLDGDDTEDDVSFTGGADTDINVHSKQNKSGTITLTATSDGLTTASGTMTSAWAGSANTLAVSIGKDEAGNVVSSGTANGQDILTLNVQVTDSQGVPLPAPADFAGGSVNFTVADGSEDQIRYVIGAVPAGKTFDDAGVATTLGTTKKFDLVKADFSATGKATILVKADKFTGDLPITVKGTDFTSGSATVSFHADKATTVGFTRTAVSVPVTAASADLVAQLYDGAGNKTAVAGIELTFALDGATLNGTKDSVKVDTDANGQAKVTVSVPAYVTRDGDDPLTVTVTGKNEAGDDDLAAVSAGKDQSTITVTDKVASSVSATIVNAVGGSQQVSVNAGTAVKVRAIVKDSQGTEITTGETLSLKVNEGDLKLAEGQDDVSDITFSYPEGADAWYADITPSQAGRLSITVSDDTAATSIAAPATALTVKAGVAARVRVKRASDDDAISVKSGSISDAFYVQLVDEFDNPVAAPAGGVKVTLDGPDGTVFRTSASGNNLDFVDNFVTIKAGTNSASFLVLTTQDADTADLQITADSSVKAGIDDTVDLTVTD